MADPDCLQDNSKPSDRQPFSFDYLWDKALRLNKTANTCVYHPQDNQARLTLTKVACLHYVNDTWAAYSNQDVYERVLLWRIPLVALCATTTLPALGFWRKVFTILHLVADPIDAIYSLCYKLNLATRHARWVQEQNDTHAGQSLFTFIGTKQPTGLGIENMKPEPMPGIKRTATRLPTDEARSLRLSKYDEVRAELKQFDIYVIALIINAYEEFHLGKAAQQAMLMSFDKDLPDHLRERIRKSCQTAAAYIAGDRVSRTLPSVIATFVFFAQISAAWWKTFDTLGPSYDPQVPSAVGLNRTPHNIAFGTLYFWLPFTVLATMFVGSANTLNSVPRILQNLRLEIDTIFDSAASVSCNLPPTSASPPQAKILHHHESESEDVGSAAGRRGRAADPHLSPGGADDRLAPDTPRHGSHERLLAESRQRIPYVRQLPPLRPNMKRRWATGGLPVWQPDKFKDWGTDSDPGAPKFVMGAFFLSVIVVTVPTVAAVWISARTPTEGFGCRTLTEVLFLAAWVGNHAFDWVLCWFFPLVPAKHKKRAEIINDADQEDTRNQRYFWITFAKDFVFVGLAIAVLVLDAYGIFNSCTCWTRWLPWNHDEYLSFPQEQFVFERIKYRLEWEFSFVVLGVFIFEIAFFGFTAWIFKNGHAILKQRDIDTVVIKVKKKQREAEERDRSTTRWSALLNRSRRRSSARTLTVRREEGLDEHSEPEDYGTTSSNDVQMQALDRNQDIARQRTSTLREIDGAGTAHDQAAPFMMSGALQREPDQM